jgi:hypothetical protein
MSFRQLLDHRVDVVRPAVPVPADSLSDERPVYTTVGSSVRCAFWPVLASIGDYGAGETPQGVTGASFERGTSVQPRDVIVTLSGPEAPKRWRVTADRSPGRRFGRAKHHIEIEAVPFPGSLPGYDTTIEEAYS